MNRAVYWLVTGIIALMLLSSMVFVVDQRRFALVFALGEWRETITEPGLHFKLPPPLQNVVFLDKRILTLDTPDNRPLHHGGEEEHHRRRVRQMAHRQPAPVLRQLQRRRRRQRQGTHVADHQERAER